MVVIKSYDCQIEAGARSIDDEIAAIRAGTSRLTNPMDSLHVVGPDRPLALAVDVAPYPVDWTKSGRFCHFAGYVEKTAEVLGVPIRWGGEWNGTWNKPGQLDDLDHFELKGI
jgi:hypothetical protein